MQIRYVKKYQYLSQAEKVAMVTVKCGVVNARIAKEMMELVPPGVPLVPIPDHTGSTEANKALCEVIASMADGDVPILDMLGCAWRQSHHNYKRHHKGYMSPEDLLFFRKPGFAAHNHPTVCLIDNVADSGATLIAAENVLEDFRCIAVVYAATNNINSFNNLKDLQTMEKSEIKTVNGKTVLVCGNCGAEIPLPEHSTHASGMTLAQDSGLGKVVLPTMGDGKGMDMASFMKLFTMGMQQMCSDPNMREQMLSMLKANEAAHASQKPADVSAVQREEIHREAEVIRSGNYLYDVNWYHNHLVRQMFEDFQIHKGTEYFNTHLNNVGSDYMWELLRHNLNIMKKCQTSDPEAFREMLRWWSPDMYAATAKTFILSLDKWVDGSWSRARSKWVKENDEWIRHKRIRTKVFRNTQTPGLVTDKEWTKIRQELNSFFYDMEDYIDDFSRFYDAYVRFDEYRKENIRFRSPKKVGIKRYQAFKDAFKGWGAYCTLQNIIMYDDVRLSDRIIENDPEASDDMLTTSRSLAKLNEMMRRKRKGEDSYHYRGWMLMGVLVDTLTYNGYDYEAAHEEFLKARGLK